ncbi:MAG: alpha/beta hydrolase [Halobacteriovoraceae bacterium]|nr:alpha/beta hydrolase [Halobacteriovoraceae bacterium]
MYPVNKIENCFNYIELPSTMADAPILVFLHGFPDNAFGWEKQFEELRGTYHLIAPFMHGTLEDGRLNRRNLELSKIKSDFKKFLVTVNPEQRELYLVGHDLGCFLGTATAHDQDLKISGLININGLGLSQYVGRKFSLSQWLKSYYILLAQFSFTRKLVSKTMPNFFLKLIYNLSGLSKDDTIRKNDSKALSFIYIYTRLFIRSWDLLFQKTRRLKTPTLFIWGKDDNFLNYPTRTEAGKYFENYAIRIIPGGHWVSRSNYKHVNRLIKMTIENWQLGASS